MKNKIIVVLLIINIILIGIGYNLSNPNEKMIGEKQLLKEMSSTDREQELDNKITELNNSATEYATYVQNCKAQIANAITEQGIATSETDTIDVVVENIKKISSTNSQVITAYSSCWASGSSIAVPIVNDSGDEIKRITITLAREASGTAVLYLATSSSGTDKTALTSTFGDFDIELTEEQRQTYSYIYVSYGGSYGNTGIVENFIVYY